VFGARGASNFLSKSTKWLAVVFFGISLFMAWYAGHGTRPAADQDLGLMSARRRPLRRLRPANCRPFEGRCGPGRPGSGRECAGSGGIFGFW
jgi:hypothetical protein